MYAYTLHRERKHFFRYSLQAVSTAGILKSHFNDCFKVNGIQMIGMPKKVNMLDSKIMKENKQKIKNKK